MAQQVERRLGKAEVTGSNPVSSLINIKSNFMVILYKKKKALSNEYYFIWQGFLFFYVAITILHKAYNTIFY